MTEPEIKLLKNLRDIITAASEDNSAFDLCQAVDCVHTGVMCNMCPFRNAAMLKDTAKLISEVIVWEV